MVAFLKSNASIIIFFNSFLLSGFHFLVNKLGKNFVYNLLVQVHLLFDTFLKLHVEKIATEGERCQ